MSNRIISTLATSILVCCLAGCGGKKVVEPTDPVTDITRPPVMPIEAPKNAAEPVDPNETISYDEWRKQQEADNETP